MLNTMAEVIEVVGKIGLKWLELSFCMCQQSEDRNNALFNLWFCFEEVFRYA